MLSLISVDRNVITVTVIFMVIIPGLNCPEVVSATQTMITDVCVNVLPQHCRSSNKLHEWSCGDV